MRLQKLGQDRVWFGIAVDSVAKWTWCGVYDIAAAVRFIATKSKMISHWNQINFMQSEAEVICGLPAKGESKEFKSQILNLDPWTFTKNVQSFLYNATDFYGAQG